MKRTAAIAAALLAAFSLFACANNNGGGAQTEAPKPTQAAEQTAAPLSFPTQGRLGNLIGGELFPKPAEYLVLKGEGDLYYAYDRMGELAAAFPALGLFSGFYGRDGIVGDFSLRLMKRLDDYSVFGQLMLRFEDGELVDFLDCYTDKTIALKSQGLSAGTAGGVLPFEGGKYLLLEAYDQEGYGARRAIRYGRCVWLDENGNITGEFDPAPFGYIEGVFGGKYILARPPVQDSAEEDYFCTTVYSQQGEALLGNVEAATAAVFYMPVGGIITEASLARWLEIASYVYDEHDNMFDQSLNRLSASVQDISGVDCVRMHYSMEVENRFIVSDNSTISYSPLFGQSATPEPVRVYVGIKDENGSWLFKIFNPALASDSRRGSRFKRIG